MAEVVERYTIKPIPEQERQGTSRSLFPFWFTANSSAFTVVLGAIGIELGLGVIPTIIAIVAGGATGRVTHNPGASRRGQGYSATRPPSMCSVSPVMNGADSRNRMPLTTSLTWPTRPIGGIEVLS